MKQEDQMIDKALSGMDERTLIKTKYPGISDDLLDKILVDANPQRKAEVMATMDEYLKLREIGKSESEAYDIITKSIRKPTKHASGGIAGQLHLHRPGYGGGKLVLDTLLKLLKGKKKNVWRGFETDYKNILRGDWYPEEFSGRFFTPDKDLAKWYAMRQGTLTGKVKKLKLTEKEIKAAQEFAEKNLKMKYGDDLLVSKELAEKAKVDLPATALAKIEAVIRKAKRTKKAKKHGQTDFASGGIAGELHLNRPGYRVGRSIKKEKIKIPDRASEMMLWLHDRIPELRYPYKSIEDIPPEVLAKLEQDPVFNVKDFLETGWSLPEETRIQTKLKGDDKAWGVTSGRTGKTWLNYLPFGENEPIAGGLLNIKTPSDEDKISTLLHELRHKKFLESDIFKSKAIPKWVRDYEYAGGEHYLDEDVQDKLKRAGQKDVSGEELYIRFLDQRYGPGRSKEHLAGSEYKPYFDKILRDKWEPHAKAYEEYLRTEKLPNPRGMRQYKYLAKGGLAHVLGV